jgi:hypothetical protein
MDTGRASKTAQTHSNRSSSGRATISRSKYTTSLRRVIARLQTFNLKQDGSDDASDVYEQQCTPKMSRKKTLKPENTPVEKKRVIAPDDESSESSDGDESFLRPNPAFAKYKGLRDKAVEGGEEKTPDSSNDKVVPSRKKPVPLDKPEHTQSPGVKRKSSPGSGTASRIQLFDIFLQNKRKKPSPSVAKPRRNQKSKKETLSPNTDQPKSAKKQRTSGNQTMRPRSLKSSAVNKEVDKTGNVSRQEAAQSEQISSTRSKRTYGIPPNASKTGLSSD